MKVLYLICAGLSFLAIAHMPYGYYTFLRIAITFVAVYAIIKNYSGELDFWIITFGVIAIIFNPIIPVHLGSRALWIPVNLVCGAVFLIKGIELTSNKKD